MRLARPPCISSSSSSFHRILCCELVFSQAVSTGLIFAISMHAHTLTNNRGKPLGSSHNYWVGVPQCLTPFWAELPYVSITPRNAIYVQHLLWLLLLGQGMMFRHEPTNIQKKRKVFGMRLAWPPSLSTFQRLLEHYDITLFRQRAIDYSEE